MEISKINQRLIEILCNFDARCGCVFCRAFTVNEIIQNRMESVVKRSKVITNSAAVASTTTTKLAIPSYILAYSANGKFGVHFKVKSHHISSIAFIRIIKIIKRMRSRRRIKREKHAHTHTHACIYGHISKISLISLNMPYVRARGTALNVFFAAHALSRRFFLCECERFTALVRTTISVCMRVFVFRSIEISYNCPKIKQQKLFWLARQLFMCLYARVIISAGMCESYLLFLRKFFGSR